MTIKTQVQAASGANFFLGIWLIIAPFALAYTQSASARWNDVIVGAAITIMAGRCVVASADAVGLSCACAVLGGWLVIAPFVLGNSAIAANVCNDVVVGLIVAVLGAWNAYAAQQLHGGGRAHQQVRWLRYHDSTR